MHRLFCSALAILYMLSSEAQAAASVQISGLADTNLGSWGMGDPAISAYMDVCVYVGNNTPAGGYYVTATSSTGSFVLKNGTRQIPFSLTWDDGGAGNLGGSAGSALNYGTALTGRLRANTNNLNPLCLVTGATARLNIKITQAAMSSALSGTYSATLTLLINPT